MSQLQLHESVTGKICRAAITWKINTSLLREAFSFSVRSHDKWLQLKETSALRGHFELEKHLQNRWLHTMQTVRVEASLLARLAPLCTQNWDGVLGDFVGSTQLKQVAPLCPKAWSHTLLKGATLLIWTYDGCYEAPYSPSHLQPII